MATIYIIDGHSYIYRAYYAIRNLSSSSGFPTNAIFGFTNMLFKIIREKNPDHLFVAFDSGKPTKRQDLYESYKAHRPSMPEDLVVQVPHIRRIIDAFRIKTLSLPGEEADDIIATLTNMARAEGLDVCLVTSDKDLYQLLGPGVTAYDTMKNRIFQADDIVERFGVEPERIPDFLALTGDSADNIPGVPGVGPKTAKTLMKEFGSVERLLQEAESIKRPRLRETVKDNADMLRLSLRLATVNSNLPLPVDLKKCRMTEPDWPGLLDIFREFELTSLAKIVPSRSINTPHKVITDKQDIDSFLSRVDGELAMQTEISGREAVDSDIVGLALALPGSDPVYIPLYPECRQSSELLAAVQPVLENPDIRKTGYNLKKDTHALQRAGITLKGHYFDAMLASYLLNPNRSGHSLEEITLLHLSRKKLSYDEAIGKGKAPVDIPVEKAAAFLSENVSIITALKQALEPLIDKSGLASILYNIEIPLISVLADMESTGIRINRDILAEYSSELEAEMRKIEQRIFFYAGEEFNVNSPKQLQEILFDKLRLTPVKKTKTGYSTDVDVLEELAAGHDLPREILEHRSLSKLKNTYVDVLPGLINPETGRVHTTFNQTATATGRLSSSNPNLQNIPVRGEWGRKIREAFVAGKEDYLLVSADYSQIELRILAHFSQDQALIDAFTDGTDAHTVTASHLFGVASNIVTQDMRRLAKTVNYGIIYGMSPFGLARQLGISSSQAKKYIDKYFEMHPGVHKYTESVVEQAVKKGFVSTMFGRQREIPELKSSGKANRQLGQRLAVNSPIQGTAADLIKIAMLNIQRGLKSKGMRSRMILQVHDELLFDAPEGEIQKLMNFIRKEMEEAATFSVPLKADIGTGKNWAEAHA